jgi:hypothetical protein
MNIIEVAELDLTWEIRPTRLDPNPIWPDFLNKSNWSDPTWSDPTRLEIKLLSIKSKYIKDLKKLNM